MKIYTIKNIFIIIIGIAILQVCISLNNPKEIYSRHLVRITEYGTMYWTPAASSLILGGPFMYIGKLIIYKNGDVKFIGCSDVAKDYEDDFSNFIKRKKERGITFEYEEDVEKLMSPILNGWFFKEREIDYKFGEKLLKNNCELVNQDDLIRAIRLNEGEIILSYDENEKLKFSILGPSNQKVTP